MLRSSEPLVIFDVRACARARIVHPLLASSLDRKRAMVRSYPGSVSPILLRDQILRFNPLYLLAIGCEPAIRIIAAL